MIRLTPHGRREMIVGSLGLAVTAFALEIWFWPHGWPVVLIFLIFFSLFIWLFAFFRDPDRIVPDDANALVAPADGRVSDITEIAHDELLGGPAVRVGIFLSVFNVHINRCPCDGKVLAVQYKQGKFINAMKHGQASEQNESNTIVLAEPSGDRPIVVVKQIVGMIARRIVCTVEIGQAVQRGQRMGMIKFGSRTELTIANWLSPQIRVHVGQPVRGAADTIALLGQKAEAKSSQEKSA